MREYAIVIEREGSSCSAYVPDLPGCVAAGDSEQEVRDLLAGAIRMHLSAMEKDGDPIPEPTTIVEYATVA